MLTKQDPRSGAQIYPGHVASASARPHALPRAGYLWALSVVNLALIAIVLVLIRNSATVSIPRTETTGELPKQEAEEIDIDALNPYGQAVARIGLPRCAKAMNDLSAKLLHGKRVGVYRFPTAHKNSVSISMEVNSGQGAIIYITFNLSEDLSGGCQIAYETVSDWSNPCDEVIKTVFKEFEPSRPLLKSVTLLTHKDNKHRKIFTMPVQGGCIAIEKQIVAMKR